MVNENNLYNEVRQFLENNRKDYPVYDPKNEKYKRALVNFVR
jgi:hypothetical protein